MTTITTPSSLALVPSLETAWQDVDSSFERFCLTAGIGAIEQMLCEDAQQLAGTPHNRGGGRVGHRWGTTKGKIGFHGGKVAVHRPRVRSYEGHEVELPTWMAAQAEDWLGRWAMNLMLINVSTRKLRRAVRLPEGDLPVIAGDGTSKSAVSRRFVALSAERLAEWMTSDLSKLDLLVIQIDGLHIGNDLVLVAALGIDGEGKKHPLGLVEGATENAAVVQTLIDNLIERGLDPKVPRLFIIDGAKALSKVIRSTFGRHTPIQRCQIHKARNVIERLPKSLHASVRKALRQAWELDDADKAERLLRNLARRLEHEAPGVAASILEGLDEMLTVNRLGLPGALRRSLACTNSIENMMGTVRRVCRNVKRWQDAAMALRWTAAGMIEAAKGFRRLKAYKQLPILRAAIAAYHAITSSRSELNRKLKPHSIVHRQMPASPTSTKPGAIPIDLRIRRAFATNAMLDRDKSRRALAALDNNQLSNLSDLWTPNTMRSTTRWKQELRMSAPGQRRRSQHFRNESRYPAIAAGEQTLRLLGSVPLAEVGQLIRSPRRRAIARTAGRSPAPLEESIVRRIRHAQERTARVTRSVGRATFGVDSLDRRGAGELARPTLRRNLEFEQRDVFRRRTGSATGHLAGHRAAVGQFPTRTCIVPTDGLAVGDQRRNRLAELPDELATAIRLAFVDLGALGVNGQHHRLTGRGDRIGHLRGQDRGDRRRQEACNGDDCERWGIHCYSPFSRLFRLRSGLRLPLWRRKQSSVRRWSRSQMCQKAT